MPTRRRSGGHPTKNSTRSAVVSRARPYAGQASPYAGKARQYAKKAGGHRCSRRKSRKSRRSRKSRKSRRRRGGGSCPCNDCPSGGCCKKHSGSC